MCNMFPIELDFVQDNVCFVEYLAILAQNRFKVCLISEV